MPTALAFIAAAVAVGAIGWSGEVLLLPVACLFPALWAFAPTRLVAALVSMGYFMAASRGLPVGVSIFYTSDMWLGLMLWVVASLSFVLVHTALWTRKPGWGRAMRYCIAALMMCVPPFGIVGWASPITAAGVLFPGWGWFGLAATAIGLIIMTTRCWPVVLIVLAGVYSWSTATRSASVTPDGWVGIDTSFFPSSAGQYADYAQHMETIALVRKAAQQGAARIILPESSLGVWTPTTERLWMKTLTEIDVSVIGGAVVVGAEGYNNVMVQVTGWGGHIRYRERMPVPVAMWQPWQMLTGQSGGAQAQFFANPVADFGEIRVAPLICYEQLLVWPILQSMLLRPDVIVAISNDWWIGDTEIAAIQKASVEAWASLFGVNLVSAFNK